MGNYHVYKLWWYIIGPPSWAYVIPLLCIIILVKSQFEQWPWLPPIPTIRYNPSKQQSATTRDTQAPNCKKMRSATVGGGGGGVRHDPAGCPIASRHPLVVLPSCPLFVLACCRIASPCPLVAPYSLTWFHPVWYTKYQKYSHLVQNLRYRRICIYSYIEKVLCGLDFWISGRLRKKVLYHV